MCFSRLRREDQRQEFSNFHADHGSSRINVHLEQGWIHLDEFDDRLDLAQFDVRRPYVGVDVESNGADRRPSHRIPLSTLRTSL